MDRICDEILQLIFYELIDPSPLTLVSQRFHHFSQDPYVRAHYFLVHYGPMEAMYHALGRGKVLSDRVLDILLSSGAHLSRYLIQVAMHHYFYTQTHFIKTSWVKNIPLRVFAYFLKLSEDRYGEIPRGKGEDDGSIFTTFLKESRLPPQMKSVTWETIKSLMDTYNFIPFCNRDPIMSQFPLALAIEPRLLPCAIANGFSMDYKYRDFVFRKMFERPTLSSEARAEDIADNVRELCKLDPAMFVSRTVAAEVCMEAKSNDIGYAALKLLDKSGHLRFELSVLVEDLLQTFLSTRSICSVSTGDNLLHLFTDFPSNHAAVRLVVLVVVFLSADNLYLTHSAIRTKLETLGVTPITRRDLFNVLVNPFIERYNSVISFARQEVIVNEDGMKGMNVAEIESLVEEVASRCLEIACKGKLLKSLSEEFPSINSLITRLVLRKFQIYLEDLPGWDPKTYLFPPYTASLCHDFTRYGVGEVHTIDNLVSEQSEEAVILELTDVTKNEADVMDGKLVVQVTSSPEPDAPSALGEISQETLTTMIRHDEATPARSRRMRIQYSYGVSDISSKFRYPQDPLHVGKWIRSCYGSRSAVTAVFMTHAVINDNCSMLHSYLMCSEPSQLRRASGHVPVTLKHFEVLAHLGRAPNFYLWNEVETGVNFYRDEHDYISKTDAEKFLLARGRIKVEAPREGSLLRTLSSSDRGKKRPRRSAAITVQSYAVPDSDDEAIAEDESKDQEERKVQHESNLQLWVKHLGQLLKEETRKYNVLKKQIEKSSDPDARVRLQKNDFLKFLTTKLRTLRKIEQEHRLKDHHLELVDEYSDDEEDDDYTTRRTKRRKPVFV
ncbi:hypothetical protein M413DRAFT_18303 [Hebeloma cylindrosporum]|uniref:Uncharacterized protein n=1 Tax=Hebeloma cylindrosporum TaxID=76867 RepID=A0A0C2YQC6_HEBCY|nr:hypothetical protein M413DRAFT_18303 [Hebeloma cylindrosporum h7]